MSLRSRVVGGDPLLGLILKVPAHSAVELAGHLGFDFVLLDTEHASAETVEVEQHIRAGDAAGIPVLVRVAGSDPSSALHALDAGAAGIVFPHVSNAEDAEAAVRAAHYPPRGIRSLAVSTRAGRHGTLTLDEHLARSARETVVVVQAEDRHSVQNCAAIAATEGVDAVWIGPTDLSLSLGIPGDFEHADYRSAVDRITEAVKSAPQCSLCALVHRPDQIEEWRSRGAGILLFNYNTVVVDGLRNIVDLARE
ncbi:HpcH/HpaI aldolase family protein [Amycolatopsis regifaucium]|uniref:2,4-dihydroxyhept-2-ene-1,7-dioic acid aldolase n=1 Tax=Amycolatopsis regifaucium TaxID=546365 RepID=A0A154MVC2_9PSEU|nr:aldolase/citrate lyase family protein [Amycolatopsis regifaucium]KZB87990.1 2,4-dihydroxyhept-2-ene-1,7-dioic acid aldolase [Amycolatopsis regifaucium]OKA04504.1 2,4-dihydroxyhept-2-ene-1,7-dioic acid aldolase [Amycolatopsis regifaucium]SFH50850.1 4-hydroxy-2-oxoheptanedioate aldolase [Amycolatopsis regifaucium]